jgi:hypothetical protein
MDTRNVAEQTNLTREVFEALDECVGFQTKEAVLEALAVRELAVGEVVTTPDGRVISNDPGGYVMLADGTSLHQNSFEGMAARLSRSPSMLHAAAVVTALTAELSKPRRSETE